MCLDLKGKLPHLHRPNFSSTVYSWKVCSGATLSAGRLRIHQLHQGGVLLLRVLLHTSSNYQINATCLGFLIVWKNIYWHLFKFPLHLLFLEVITVFQTIIYMHTVSSIILVFFSPWGKGLSQSAALRSFLALHSVIIPGGVWGIK